MKKIFVAILVIALICSTTTPACFAASNGLEPEQIVSMVDARSIVSQNTIWISGGVAYITLFCDPDDASVNQIQATSHIEKYVGNQWVTVPLENGDTEWTNIVSGGYMNIATEQKIMTGDGRYRVVTMYASYFIGVGNKYTTATSAACNYG